MTGMLDLENYAWFTECYGPPAVGQEVRMVRRHGYPQASDMGKLLCAIFRAWPVWLALG